jgi:hypothetical protein
LIFSSEIRHLEFRGIFDLSAFTALLLEVFKETWAHKQLKFINMAGLLSSLGNFLYILKVNLANCVTEHLKQVNTTAKI